MAGDKQLVVQLLAQTCFKNLTLGDALAYPEGRGVLQVAHAHQHIGRAQEVGQGDVH